MEVGPLQGGGGASTGWRWGHYRVEVGPLQGGGGATTGWRWGHYRVEVGPLQGGGGATTGWRWGHYRVETLSYLSIFSSQPPPSGGPIHKAKYILHFPSN